MRERIPTSLIDSLSHAASLDAAVRAVGAGVADLDRDCGVAVLRIDPRAGIARECLVVSGEHLHQRPLEASLEQLPASILRTVQSGEGFAELVDDAPAYAKLFRIAEQLPAGTLYLRGFRADGALTAVLAITIPRRVFGARGIERFGSVVALFALAYARISEREARGEAERALETVTQRLHAEYQQRLASLEQRFAAHTGQLMAQVSGARSAAERDEAARAEELRRATRQVSMLEQQLTASVGELEQAHVDLHRRSAALRQRTRTLYLLERALTLAAAAASPQLLIDGLLALLGEDMEATRCSIFFRVPGQDRLYLAASQGLPASVRVGHTITIGHGIAGRVAASREPYLVVDVADAVSRSLLHDSQMNSGSFISFPLVYHDAVLGVVNLTNRAQHGVFVEEDIERVRLLSLVISVVATEAALPARLAPETA